VLNKAHIAQKLDTKLNTLLPHINDINQPDSQGDTLLHSAAEYGLVDCLKKLILAGADLDATNNSFGDTALHLAAVRGKLNCVKALVQAGATIDQPNSHRLTAFHFAIEKNNSAVVEYLLEMGALHNIQYISSQQNTKAGAQGPIFQVSIPCMQVLLQLSIPSMRAEENHISIDPQSKLGIAIYRGLKKYTARKQWLRIAPLIAFYRANAKHPFQDSILTLIPDEIAPFLDGDKKKQDKNKLAAKLWETRGVATAKYPSLAQMFEEDKAARLAQTRGVTTATYVPLEQMFTEEKAAETALKQNAQKIQSVKKPEDQE
jgi:hypothetical protein